MNCWIYRSSRYQGLYLYLPTESGFEEIPATLVKMMGTPSLVMELELSPERQLAQVDAAQVMENLRTSGYFLQIPPDFKPHWHLAE